MTTRHTLRALAEAIGRGQGHTTTAIRAADLAARQANRDGGQFRATLIVAEAWRAAELTKDPPPDTAFFQVLSLEDVARLNGPLAGPVILDPQVIQELATELFPSTRLNGEARGQGWRPETWPPEAEDAVINETRIRLGWRDLVKAALGGEILVRLSIYTPIVIPGECPTRAETTATRPWWWPRAPAPAPQGQAMTGTVKP